VGNMTNGISMFDSSGLSTANWDATMKCGHTKGCEKVDYRYHCYNCQHIESATTNILFNKVKFGLQKAFCVVFEMSTSSKSISSIQMGKRFSIRQGTAWYFM
jgi:hypothetical protein